MVTGRGKEAGEGSPGDQGLCPGVTLVNHYAHIYWPEFIMWPHPVSRGTVVCDPPTYLNVDGDQLFIE